MKYRLPPYLDDDAHKAFGDAFLNLLDNNMPPAYSSAASQLEAFDGALREALNGTSALPAPPPSTVPSTLKMRPLGSALQPHLPAATVNCPATSSRQYTPQNAPPPSASSLSVQSQRPSESTSAAISAAKHGSLRVNAFSTPMASSYT